MSESESKASADSESEHSAEDESQRSDEEGSDKSEDNSEETVEFSDDAVAEWSELLQHSKTRKTAVSCLVYISNAIKTARLNPLRVQIDRVDEEDDESYEKVGSIEINDCTRIDVVSSEEWTHSFGAVVRKFRSFIKSYLDQTYTRNLRLLDPRNITRFLRSWWDQPVWSKIHRRTDTNKSIARLTAFFENGGNEATERPAQHLLNAIVSIGLGHHIDRASPLHEAVKQRDYPLIAKALILFGAEPIMRRITDEDEEDEEEEQSEYEEDEGEEEEGEEEESDRDEDNDITDEDELEEDDDEEEYEEEEEEGDDENEEESEDEEEESEDEERSDEESEENEDDDMRARSDEMAEVLELIITPTKQRASNKSTGNKSHLLSLDGGGIRGLILTTILAEIDREIPGIVDSCSWAAGTSTGSILALALAHGNTIDECRNMYFKFKDVVFTPSQSGYVDYDVSILERFLKRIFVNADGEPTTMQELREMSGKNMISTSVDRSKSKFATVLFKNYQLPTDSSDDSDKLHLQDPADIPVWETARCTSAAPFYFKSHKEYGDGGITNNNPTVLLLDQWYTYKKSIKAGLIEDEKPIKLGAVISIGTGKEAEEEKPKIGMKEVLNLLGLPTLSSLVGTWRTAKQFFAQIAKSDGDVVEASRNSTRDRKGSYFRFTPIYEKEIRMNETNNEILIEMMWTAKVYMREQVKEMHLLKKVLASG